MSDTRPQDNEDAKLDEAAAAELDGVPEAMKEGGDEGSDETSQDDRIAALENELAEAKQQVLYAQAETQNVRRRLEKDAQDAKAYAATGFARDILSVSDNLQRALAAIPNEIKNEEKWKGLIGGIEATGRELETVFEKNGIKRVASVGLPLDPNQHQAMVEVPTDEQEPGTVVQEMQAGYMIKDRLLRPAFVGVAKKPE
ncbi:nucleotide exchange factor GrpE [Parasphingorhabdus cellanae]|uniref:Protein GrpE n=1 Tax=Parasphingorhabdus cellanae TaxID=2806553 RepID=A0ABX7T225_9SPHN|nr:nucleotide exchange factor GrpE [Parasphingorhabdus cellanae]QTD55615.1 nucleotide exchange factor GrpE [Parasphingorhabdus cellanae]